MHHLTQSIRYIVYTIVLVAIALTTNINTVSASTLEITSPDDKFYVVAKYDFEANNPENFDTPYYWWAVYDTQTHQFLEKYFQRDISDEEALNNNKLEDVIFLEGDQEYLVGAVYCNVPLEDPLALRELPDGCSFTIKQVDIRGFELWGTIKGVAPPEQNYLYGSPGSVSWDVTSSGFAPPNNKNLLYTWGIYSYDLNKIIEIKDNTGEEYYYLMNEEFELGLGNYIVGVFICNQYTEIDPEDPLQNFDPENCIILTRPFEIVEYIHAEPLVFQEGRTEDILIKGSLPKTDLTELHYPEFNKIKATVIILAGMAEFDEMDLFDDGQHGDDEAGDEIYGNYYNVEHLYVSGYGLDDFKLYFNDDKVYDYEISGRSYFYIPPSSDKCFKIVDNGSVEDKLDIVIVGGGGGFGTVQDLLEVVYAQEKYFTGEYGIEPFKSNGEKMNWYVSTHLSHELCELDPSNYLHCPHDKVIYFTTRNTKSYATLGGIWALVSLPPQTYDNYYAKKTGTTVHEFGHSFGSLLDEYTMAGPDYAGQPNCADSLDEVTQWWGDKVGEGKGVLEVLSADEISIIGTGPMTKDEFIEKYGGWPDGRDEYNKCLLDLDDCINKNDFLRSDNCPPGYICPTGVTFPGCSLIQDNYRPTLLSTMRDSSEALNDLVDEGLGVFKDYYWWKNWFGPVNQAHLQELLNNYH